MNEKIELFKLARSSDYQYTSLHYEAETGEIGTLIDETKSNFLNHHSYCLSNLNKCH